MRDYRDRLDRQERLLRAAELRNQRRFLRRAITIAERDGIPPEGSDEIRLHGPIEKDRYFNTNQVMVSFRIGQNYKRPVALLEQMWVNTENTPPVFRFAVAVDLRTGHAFDQRLFFQCYPGEYTSVLASAEKRLNELRKKKNRELKHRKEDPFNAHVFPYIDEISARLRNLVPRFQAAAARMNLPILQGTLDSNRNLFQVPEKLQIAGNYCVPLTV